MKENEICFILCTNDRLYAEECMYYIRHLIIPEGYTIDILTVEDAKSMTSGYNEAMRYSQAKYKVYLHHDTFIVNPHFIRDMLDVFRKDPEIGMLGMVGAPTMPINGIMWETARAGMLYQRMVDAINYREMKLTNQTGGGSTRSNDVYWEVEAIDGFLMATQYDIPWREDLFDKWDFYDASQSMEFIRHGYKVVVPKMKEPWCLHDCGYVSFDNYEEERKKYVQEYLK